MISSIQVEIFTNNWAMGENIASLKAEQAGTCRKGKQRIRFYPEDRFRNKIT
jgi:hypothetical protein